MKDWHNLSFNFGNLFKKIDLQKGLKLIIVLRVFDAAFISVT